MRVYIELNDLAGVQNIPFWQEKLKDFESLRNSENGTHDLFQSLEDEDMVTLACIGTKIIKDWDRLSFFRLYTRCCQVWNSRHLYDIIDFRLVQSGLNINDKTIEYACKVDLEHIETLFNTRDKEGLTKLLHYSEDCDDSEYQCSYKVKAENKIKRCLDRLNKQTNCVTESIVSTRTSTATKAGFEILDIPEAKILLDRLVESKILDSDYSLGATHLSTAAVIADAISRTCNITKKNVLFSALWKVTTDQLRDGLQTAKRTADKSNYRDVLSHMFVKKNSFGTFQTDGIKVDEMMKNI